MNAAELDAWIRTQRRADNETETFHVYRCYDADNQLLYVGCTQDINARMAVHRSTRDNPASGYLQVYMDHWTTEEVAGFTAAHLREREVISAEAPLLNVLHNKGRGLKRTPATQGRAS